jgi:hypothetical protein
MIKDRDQKMEKYKNCISSFWITAVSKPDQQNYLQSILGGALLGS